MLIDLHDVLFVNIVSILKIRQAYVRLEYPVELGSYRMMTTTMMTRGVVTTEIRKTPLRLVAVAGKIEEFLRSATTTCLKVPST